MGSGQTPGKDGGVLSRTRFESLQAVSKCHQDIFGCEYSGVCSYSNQIPALFSQVRIRPLSFKYDERAMLK